MRHWYAVALIVFTCLGTAGANLDECIGLENRALESNPIVQCDYATLSQFPIRSESIVLHASPRHILRLSHWLDEIYSVPHGRETIDAILASGHRLAIRDSSWALASSGRTLAPVSQNLTNGRGEDVEILFDARMPNQGSHWVFDRHDRRIEFTATQNLFHELAHARHLMNGTWLYFDSEGQAIQEENIFRRQQAELTGQDAFSRRISIKGEQYWWPETATTMNAVAANL